MEDVASERCLDMRCRPLRVPESAFEDDEELSQRLGPEGFQLGEAVPPVDALVQVGPQVTWD